MPKYKCKKCSYTTPSLSAMERHVANCHPSTIKSSNGAPDDWVLASAYAIDYSSNDSYSSSSSSDSFSGGGGDFGGGGASSDW